MDPKEIKAVFDRTFNGMPNPVFCHPYAYFERNGYLCEAADSASGGEIAKIVERDLYKTPLAIFEMVMGDCGAWLTVLTKDGERTRFGGHFDTEDELKQLLEEIK
jgi:hypothetical protein